jgi:long-chain fatty acid transport protein
MTRAPRYVASLCSATLCLLLPRLAHAGGFQLAEQSAEALGMASAVSASTVAPDAVWYDPAALVFVDGVQASLSGTAYLGSSQFTPRGEGDAIDAEPTRQLVPSFFASARVSDRIAVGLGVAVPFGLGVEWPHDWVGRDYGIESSLMVVDFNPVVAFKLLPKLSIAAGFDLMRGAVDLERGLPTAGTDTVRISGDAWGFGANVALLYRIVPEQLHLALSYRSRARLKLGGQADFEVTEPVFSTRLFDQRGSATLTLPDVITLGAMFRPDPRVRIGLDANAVLWSTFDRIPIDFADPATPDAQLVPDYHDTVNVRLGAEWSTPVRGLRARIGLIVDPNPAPETGLSPSLPDGMRLDASAGVGYHGPSLGIDAGYMLVIFLRSDARAPSDPTQAPQSPEGSYRTTAHLIGLTLTGRLSTAAHDVRGSR